MSRTRTITTSLTLAAALLAPSAAVARHGADDPAGDDRGGQAPAGAVVAKGGRARTDQGSCTGASAAKLKVKPDDGRLETEFEVDQNRNGVRWQVTLRRNGRIAVRTTATTRAPSGSFSVERRLGDRAGRDTVTARATSPSGEVCTARVTI